MGESTGIVVAVGGITAANELLFAPLANGTAPWKDFNWRILPATAVLALVLDGMEKISVPFAKGLAYIALITVVFAQTGSAPAPAVNLAKAMGYLKDVS
jgi:hypothetical protein